MTNFKEKSLSRKIADDIISFILEENLHPGDKLPTEDKTKVEADLAALKSLVESTDPENMSDYDVEQLKNAKETLMTSAQNLFAKLYEQNGPGANAGTGATGPADYSEGDVVDGDYTEL